MKRKFSKKMPVVHIKRWKYENTFYKFKGLIAVLTYLHKHPRLWQMQFSRKNCS